MPPRATWERRPRQTDFYVKLILNFWKFEIIIFVLFATYHRRTICLVLSHYLFLAHFFHVYEFWPPRYSTNLKVNKWVNNINNKVQISFSPLYVWIWISQNYFLPCMRPLVHQLSYYIRIGNINFYRNWLNNDNNMHVKRYNMWIYFLNM